MLLRRTGRRLRGSCFGGAVEALQGAAAGGPARALCAHDRAGDGIETMNDQELHIRHRVVPMGGAGGSLLCYDLVIPVNTPFIIGASTTLPLKSVS